ncbi:MAG: alanine racemase [Clostridiaceae bacterium]|nr:alanine racemase [Clostridiaceae bacterium]
MKITRPTWLEIDLDKLSNNYREIRRIVKHGTDIMAILKADAYQHGAILIAKTLMENGVNKFAVANLSEAIHLRKTFDTIDILVLGYTPDHLAEDVINYGITQTIYEGEQAQLFSDIAKQNNKEIKVHLKIETGMNRLGFTPKPASIDILEKICSLPNMFVEGIFSHFASADEADKTFTYQQVEKFNYVCNQLEKRGINIPIKHIANSAAILDLPDMNFNMVRPGIILYGVYPGESTNNAIIKLKPVMSLRTEISYVKEIQEGEKIGYGLTYECHNKRKIATLPLGYADGFSRLLTGKGEVIAAGTKAPIVGGLCMDQCMIDVTGLDVKRGDIVTLIGSDGKENITIEEVAEKASTIPAGVMVMMNKRIPRVYFKNNRIFNVTDYMLEL